MKKTKFFMSIGSLVLACSAFLAAKPAKKFATFQTAKVVAGPFAGVLVVGPSSTFFTTFSNTKTAIFKTKGGIEYTLFTKVNGLITAFVK